MSFLFEPLQLRSLTIPNRLVMSPMCQYSAKDGFANDWHLAHLGSRAAGKTGLIMMEATAVSPEGRITPYDLGIYHDAHIEPLRRITQFVRENGSVIGIQLAHAGRKGSSTRPWEGGKPLAADEGGWTNVAPSALPFREGSPVPEALDEGGIEALIRSFAIAAQRSLQAGFEVIEIHAAHGYLIHQFLSPLSNNRTDEWGGSFENRIRFLLRIVEAVRAVWPETLPLFVRISATDWTTGGWTIEDSIALAGILKNKGVDLIDCSSGGIIPGVRIPIEPLYQTPFATSIKKEADIATGAVGLITTAEESEKIVADGLADLVFIGRQFLRDPHFALHAAQTLGANIAWPVQYERSQISRS